MNNKIYRTIAIFGMFLGLAMVNAQGQTLSRARVNIPFEFSAGKTTLHAGVYDIKRMSADVVSLRSEDGKSTVILHAPVTESSNNPNVVPRLVFSRQGEEYFLSQIWLSADSGRRVWIGHGAERVEIALKK
jgi:hypothetical protein